MKVGDLVTTDSSSKGSIGVVIEVTQQLCFPSAKVFIEGKVKECDIENLWSYYESR